MRLIDAVIIAGSAFYFSYWVRHYVKTMREAYYCGVALGLIFYIGAVHHCAG